LSPKLRKHIPAKHLRRESGAAAGFPKPAPGCPFFSEQRLPATGQTTSYVAGDDGETSAGAPLRYRDNGDGTITDKNTKLMWEKKDQASGGLHNWNNTYPWGTCSNNILAGYRCMRCVASSRFPTAPLSSLNLTGTACGAPIGRKSARPIASRAETYFICELSPAM
jgi:hypothetical protein